MSKIVYVIAVLATVCLCSTHISAQSIPSCYNATGLPFGLAAGTWYAVARNPPLTNVSCITLDIEQQNNQWLLNTSYSSSQSSDLINTFDLNAPITLNATGNNMNITGAITGQMATLKIVATDNKSYAVLCGYTNATDNSTDFGIILANTRTPTEQQIMTYQYQGSNATTAFTNATVIANLTQSQSCHTSGAVRSMPILSVLFALVLATLIKLN